MTIEHMIKDKVQAVFSPIHFEVINESSYHSGHAGDDGSGQTHFKLVVVSRVFEGLGRVARQQAANEALSDAFEQGLHAISYRLFAPDEYSE